MYDLKNNKRPSLLDIPLPPGEKGFKKVVRHTKQVLNLFSSSTYRSYENLKKQVQTSYSTPTEIEFWGRVAEYGLEKYELKALKDARADSELLKSKDTWDILMVGCGAGREAFGLENLGHNVVATDLSDSLLAVAKDVSRMRKSKVEFYQGSLPSGDSKKYDLIFVTNALLNLIPGRGNRVNFLKGLQERAKEGTRILLFADVEKLNPKYRLYWISKLLKFKSLIGMGEYEKGDIVSSSLGNWAGDSDPILFHYFPTPKDFLSELNEAGLTATPKWGIFWLAKNL